MEKKSPKHSSRKKEMGDSTPRRGSIDEHNQLVNDILLKVGGNGTCIIWRNETGRARNFRDPDEIFSYGLPGSPDILGFAFGGAFIGIECKTGAATTNSNQRNFQAACQKYKAHYRVCRSVQDALDFVNYVIRGTHKT